MCLTAFKAVMDLGRDDQEEENNNDRKMIRRPPPSDTDRWNALPPVPSCTEMGYLHLSFEYYRGALKVRVWQISDLLLPPPQISMIHSIFVRGYFIPDKINKTMRKTEEVFVEEPPDNAARSNEPGSPKSGIQHILTPSSFKFRTALIYTGMTRDIVKERSIQVEVCVTQKRTRRVYLAAMVHMPLRAALRRPIRQKYPLIPCTNLTIPNNMRLYSATAHLLNYREKNGGNWRCKQDGVWLGQHCGHAESQNGNYQGDGISEQERKGDNAQLTGKGGDSEEEEGENVALSAEDFLRSHQSLCVDDDDDSDDDGLGGSVGMGNEMMWTSTASSSRDSGGSSSTPTPHPTSSTDEGEDIEYSDEGGTEDRAENGCSREEVYTPVDNAPYFEKPMSSSKKKIIPNELQEDECTAHQAIADHVAPEDSTETHQSTPPRSPTEVVQEQEVSPVINSESTDSKPARRKIIPAEVETTHDPAEGDLEEDSSNNVSEEQYDPDEDTYHTDDREDTDTETPSNSPREEKKKKIPLPEDGSITSHPNTVTTTNAEGLSPNKGVDGSKLTPDFLSPDAAAFTPASRPETPCWDFYDFAEDLQAEEDVEVPGLTIELSLSKLRQQEIGDSLQNLSMEPILPMDLVDDFDTLAVDGEEHE